MERAHDGTLAGALDLNADSVHGDVHGAVAETEQHRTHNRDGEGGGERERDRRRDEQRQPGQGDLAGTDRVGQSTADLHRRYRGQTSGEQHDRDVGGVDVQPLTDGGECSAVSADDEPVHREEQRHGDDGLRAGEADGEIVRACGGRGGHGRGPGFQCVCGEGEPIDVAARVAK